MNHNEGRMDQKRLTDLLAAQEIARISVRRHLGGAGQPVPVKDDDDRRR